MEKITIFLAVVALMAALSPSSSEARYWGICKSALSDAWGSCRYDTSSAECCNAVGDVAEQCPSYFRWWWLRQANARCEAKKKTPVPVPVPTPPSPRLSCKINEVLVDCMKEMSYFHWHVTTTISRGCCKSILHLLDDCPGSYEDYWKTFHAYCVNHH